MKFYINLMLDTPSKISWRLNTFRPTIDYYANCDVGSYCCVRFVWHFRFHVMRDGVSVKSNAIREFQFSRASSVSNAFGGAATVNKYLNEFHGLCRYDRKGAAICSSDLGKYFTRLVEYAVTGWFYHFAKQTILFSISIARNINI